MPKSRKERKMLNLKEIEHKEKLIKLEGTGKILEMTRRELEISLWESNLDRVIDWLKENGVSDKKQAKKKLEEFGHYKDIMEFAFYANNPDFRFSRYHDNYWKIIDNFKN